MLGIPIPVMVRTDSLGDSIAAGMGASA